MNRGLKNITIFLLILLITVFIYSNGIQPPVKVEDITYSQFQEKVAEGTVLNVTIQPDASDSYFFTGDLKNGNKFSAIGPLDTAITNYLDKYNIEYKFMPVEKASWWSSLLISLIPMLLIIGLFIFMMNQSQGGGGKVMQFGKSRAKLHTDEKKKVTFADVAGVDEVKEELAEVVDFLKSPRKYTLLGAKIPKGVLLYGPPGTGKTLLARAVAGESGVPFFTISGSDFVEMFVGVGASRVRDLFDNAKKQAPCIIFIDEIDAVGRQRGAGLGGGHDEREQTLNQLLVEMDGFAANEGIIVIAGTNRPDILDPALLRPGRFDRQVTVDAPDVVGRKAILEVHIKGKPLADDVDLSVLARPGFTGADLANMLNEAALLAARYNKNLIGMEEMEQAVERVIAGPEKKSKVISDAEKKLVSYHEAGHAVVAYYVPNSDPLHKISIIPRGRAGGYTLLLPQEDTHYDTKSKMMDQIAIFLGGRMAEILVLKEISTGASNDLERATDMVRQMITRYGMSDDLGPLTFGKAQTQVFLGRDISQERNYSEAIAFAIDKEARRMMDEAYHRAQTILSEHMDKLEKVAQTLMEKETIEAAEFYAIMEDKQYTEPIDINPVEPKAEAVSEAVPANTNGEATSLKVTYNGENTKTEIRKNPEIKSSSEDDPMNRWLK